VIEAKHTPSIDVAPTLIKKNKNKMPFFKAKNGLDR
jgi:hypothetical protein